MNELMITLLENDWLLYAACGAAGAGGLIQIILSVIYNRSLNASERMRNTKISWLRQMKTRYESGYEWNNRIRNVGLFVDKNIGRRKWMGIYLKTWEELSKMMLPLVLVLAVLGAVCAGIYMEDQTMPLVYLVTGAALILVLRGLITLANLKEKQNLLRTNLCDYFENTLRGEAKNRRRENLREQEAYFGKKVLREELACAADEENVLHSEEIAEKDSKKAAIGVAVQNEETTMAAIKVETDDKCGSDKTIRISEETTEVNRECIGAKSQAEPEVSETVKQRREAAKLAKAAAKNNKKALKQEKKKERQLGKLAKKEAKQLKRQEKEGVREAAKLQRKQAKEQKRVDKLTKRMNKMQLRLGTTATVESVRMQSCIGGKLEENARLKREQLKRKVDVTPAQEDQIIADVLREFLA